MRPLLLAVLLAPAAALAQPAGLDSTGADSTLSPPDTTETAGRAFLFAFDAVVDSVAKRRDMAKSGREVVESNPLARNVLSRSTQPTVRTFGETGLLVTLPPGWDGPTSAAEASLPRYALYTFRNEAPGHPLAGAVLRAERVTGLNALYRERWLRGQTTYGYHGSAPVGPAPVPFGFGLEVAGAGTGGAIAFLERGPAMWAVGVEAPAALWAARRGELLALLAGVQIP